MESVGARLKKLRLEKGLTLEDAHKKTKIHLNILKAIEEDSLVNINPIYIKGFLKIYCKFLGVDPKDYMLGYQESQSIVARKSSEAPGPSYIKLGSFSGINKKIRTVFIFVFIAFFTVGLFKLGKFISSKHKPRRKEAKISSRLTTEKAKPKAQATKLNKAQNPIVSLKDKKLDAGVVKEGAPVQVQSGIRLGMRPKEDSWVHLKVDGRVVFHNILKKGRFESWEAKDKIEFTLSNAGVIELDLNGKTIPPLGRRGQAIKNVIITREEGLVVPR